jgi:hypothetical protein
MIGPLLCKQQLYTDRLHSQFAAASNQELEEEIWAVVNEIANAIDELVPANPPSPRSANDYRTVTNAARR